MIDKKYFKLKYSTTIKEIGCWKQMDVPDKYWEIDNNFESIDWFLFQEKAPNLEKFELKKKAKLTDFLSSNQLDASKGMFVSLRGKEIIEKHRLFGIRFYKTSIVNHKNEMITNYFFMHIIDNYRELLNIDKSKFIDFLEDDKEVKLDTEKPIPGSVIPKKIVLNQSYDLFKNPGSIEIIISEKLQKSLLEANITGTFIEEFTRYEIHTN